MEKQYYFTIHGYDHKDDMGNYFDVTEFEVLDTNVENALKRVEELYKRPFYRVKGIVEKNDKS